MQVKRQLLLPVCIPLPVLTVIGSVWEAAMCFQKSRCLLLVKKTCSKTGFAATHDDKGAMVTDAVFGRFVSVQKGFV